MPIQDCYLALLRPVHCNNARFLHSTRSQFSKMKHSFLLPTLAINGLGVTAGIVSRQANGGSANCCFSIAVLPSPGNLVVNSTGFLGIVPEFGDSLVTGPPVLAYSFCYQVRHFRRVTSFTRG